MAGTNILQNLELNRQTESLMKQSLIANDKTALAAAYTALIADLTVDLATVNATTNVDTLQS